MMRPLSTGHPASPSTIAGKKSPNLLESPKAHLVCKLPFPYQKAALRFMLNCASPLPPSSCVTHLPAIPKLSLSGQEQPLRALQIILGKAIEVATEPTNLAPVGARHSHLHLGLPIPQHLCREAGTGKWGKAGAPGSPVPILAASARPLL